MSLWHVHHIRFENYCPGLPVHIEDLMESGEGTVVFRQRSPPMTVKLNMALETRLRGPLQSTGTKNG